MAVKDSYDTKITNDNYIGANKLNSHNLFHLSQTW